MEQYRNGATTTLASTADPTDTVITVTSSIGFPGAGEGEFRIQINNEILLVTGVSGNTWTVERGQEETSAATHAATTDVNHTFTAEVIDRATVSKTAVASVPATAPDNKIFVLEDAPVQEMKNVGSLGPSWFLKPPPNTGWTELNFNGNTTRRTSSMYQSIKQQGQDGIQLRGITRSPQFSDPYYIIAGIMCCFTNSFPAGVGLLAAEDSSGEYATWGVHLATDQIAHATGKWTTVSSRIEHAVSAGNMAGDSIRWLCLAVEADQNLGCYYSVDRIHWLRYNGVTTFDGFLNQIDRIGFFVVNNATIGSYGTLIHWEEIDGTFSV